MPPEGGYIFQEFVVGGWKEPVRFAATLSALSVEDAALAIIATPL